MKNGFRAIRYLLIIALIVFSSGLMLSVIWADEVTMDTLADAGFAIWLAVMAAFAEPRSENDTLN